MNLRQLEMFKMVAETEGFTKAGEEMHVSHSAVSRQIKLLEEELQVPLFIRGNERVSLTEPGKVLLNHVATIFGAVSNATQSLRQMPKNVQSLLNLATGTTMLSFFLRSVFKGFKKRYPTVDIHVTTGQSTIILAELHRGTIDVILGALPLLIEKRRDLVVLPVYREELVVVVGKHHPFNKKNLICAEELNEFPFVMHVASSATRRILEDEFRELNISPSVQLEVENDEAIEKAITTGQSMSFLSKRRASQDGIHFLRIAGRQIFRTVGLVSLRSKEPTEQFTYFTSLCCERAKRVFPVDCLLAKTP
jgi:DNA-binding transcriptional LysR family regulator